MSEQEDLIYTNTTLVTSTKWVFGPEEAVWYLFFIYMLCCALTIRLPYCKKETYGEYFGCCLCLLYRDAISTVLIAILNIIVTIIECFIDTCLLCKLSDENKRRWGEFRNNNIIQDRCHRCFFKIKNTIRPVKAKPVDNTNINTPVVIEGLNNKNERISVLVVPINEIAISRQTTPFVGVVLSGNITV